MFTSALTASGIQLPTTCFLMHSSGMHLAKGGDNHGVLEAPDAGNPQQLKFTLVDGTSNCYNIAASDGSYLSLSGDYDTAFTYDASSWNAQYFIEVADDYPDQYLKLRCRANDKYLGVDNTSAGSYAYSNKNVPDYWWLSEDASLSPYMTEVSYFVAPEERRQQFEGWGVSLAWWANMLGKWENEKIDWLISWLVNPDGLNYRVFRYNIGGGDDPAWTNCSPHHMDSGKGRRAEMEGFKVSADAQYDWSRDAAQRRIMLKIRDKRPDAIFEAFSNTPPYYMTHSGCAAGNDNGAHDNLRPECYGEFAQYLVDVCRHYKDEYGIEFRTLEPFNESQSWIWKKGGEQEGCHFDINSQIEFVKTLSPKLREAGLSTLISTSDENAIGESVNAFVAYRRAGILDLVGQWNTHSYVGTDQERAKISALCRESGKRLWMSEVGDGGEGIRGNLAVARKLIDDMRFLMPSAWLDWQYVEENNDQWGLLSTNDYNNGQAHPTKNYYVRAQFSRFIKPGSTIITSLDPNTLAALSPEEDKLILVAVNDQSIGVSHKVDLSGFDRVTGVCEAYITDPARDTEWFGDYNLQGYALSFNMPPTSICTLVISVTPPSGTSAIDTEAAYLICPRTAASLALTPDNDNRDLRLKPVTLSDSQQWKFTPAGAGYTITNLNGEIITEHNDDYYLASSAWADGSRTFHLTAVDNVHFRIDNARKTKAFDLDNEKYVEDTKVGLWAYPDEDTEAPVHRQWSLIKVPERNTTSAASPVGTILEGKRLHAICPYPGALSIKCLQEGATPLCVYNVDGRRVYSNSRPDREDMTITLPAGYYVVTYGGASTPVVVR